MPKVLTNGKIKLGAYALPDRKRIALCVQEDNHLDVCGYFTTRDHAEFFMDKLAECTAAIRGNDSEAD